MEIILLTIVLPVVALYVLVQAYKAWERGI